MHFVIEAWRKKPFERKGMTISRGIVSTMMGLAFVAYCGYLINLLVTDKRLLLNTSENIPTTGYAAPDVETCSQKSPFTIVKCTLISMNWTATDIPGCSSYIIEGAQDENTHCKVFSAKNQGLQFRINGSDSSSIQRVDIYWKMDNITAFEQVTLAIPALAIQFYAASFSPWRQSDIVKIPQQQNAADVAKQGRYRAITLQNYTSNIYFTPLKYRAIPPGDGNSLFGLTGNYVDIETVATTQSNFPLHSSAALNTGEYHGFFTFQLATPTIDVKTEQRQHSLLTALAMAGGAYGVLLTLFVAIFGTPRISAFGFVHHVENYLGRYKDKWVYGYNDSHAMDNNNNNNNGNINKDVMLANIMCTKGSDQNSQHSSLVHLTETSSPSTTDTGKIAALTPEAEHISDRRISISGLQPAASNATLEQRIDYLEGILREYFVNVDYLDGLRYRRFAVKDQHSSSPPAQPQQYDLPAQDYSIPLRNV